MSTETIGLSIAIVVFVLAIGALIIQGIFRVGERVALLQQIRNELRQLRKDIAE